MKHITLILSLLLTTIAQAQNHVPNGDFEYYTSCPTGTSQTIRCTGWGPFVTTRTPDYFNSCSSSWQVGIPNNQFGYQYAASGDGYMGGQIEVPAAWIIGAKENITRNIIPLNIGKTYEVSISVSMANRTFVATNNIGLFFYDTIGQVTPNNIDALQPQISFKNYGTITDTLNWVRLTAYFVADSAYDNIAIGGFFPKNQITFDTLSVPQGSRQGYYYFDSVVVKEGNSYYISDHDTSYCAGDSINISCIANIKLAANNVFTIQLSNASGSFASPITLGTLTSDTSGIINGVIPTTANPGIGYKIRIISTAHSDTIVSPKTIRIGNVVIANAYVQISSNSPTCTGDTIIFTNVSYPSSLTFSWSGPNGFSSTNQAPNIPNGNVTNAGSYYLISKYYGCTILDTLQVQVKPLPNKPVASSNTPVCKYDTLSLTAASSTSGVTYNWTGPFNYNNNVQNPTRNNVPQTAGGFYTVAATLNGCSTYDTIAVTVKDAPDTITLTSNSPLCTDDTLNLYSDTSAGNVTYTWNGPNSFTSSANDTMIINAGFVNTGWYSMTVNLNGCTYTDSTYAVVTQTPSVPTLSYNSPICVGEQLQLNATSIVSGVTYNWTGANSFTSSLKSPTKNNSQFVDTGNYYATVTYNNCTSPVSTLKVAVNPTPFVVITTPADTICNGETIGFMAIPANASTNLKYTWKVNAQPQVATTNSFSTAALNNNDIVLCEMVDSNQCSVPVTDQSNQIKMTVLPWQAPSVNITANPNGIIIPWDYVQFTATSTNAGNNPKYQWKRNGKDIIGATSNIWSANNLNDNDTISVDLISDYRCPQPTTANSNSIVVRIATGINKVKTVNNLILAPNPNKGTFTLSGKLNSNGMAKIEVINMLGQSVHQLQTNITNQTLKQDIQLNNTATGLYLLKLSINNETTQIKFRVD